jgi:hypothetical protein
MTNAVMKAVAIRLDEKVSGWLHKAAGEKGLAHQLQRDFGQRDAEGRVKNVKSKNSDLARNSAHSSSKLQEV